MKRRLFPPDRLVATSPILQFGWAMLRSEEHTSELQSRVDLVCRLLLEKKKNLLSIAASVLKPHRQSRPFDHNPTNPGSPSLCLPTLILARMFTWPPVRLVHVNDHVRSH